MQLRSTRTNGFLYANAKDLIQCERIWIRVASLSLVSFRHLSVLARDGHSFRLWMGRNFVFGSEI